MKKKSNILIKLYIIFSSTLYIALVLYLLSNSLFAQQDDLKFGKLNTTHGLSQNYVKAIHQDFRGFLWFATGDGINRYDGNSIKIFRQNNSDKNSISDNIINSIFEDADSNLWIGTNKGLNKYNFRTEKFSRLVLNHPELKSLEKDEIRFAFEDHRGSFWIGSTITGLIRLDQEWNIFEKISFDDAGQSSDVTRICQTIYEDNDNNLWAGTSDTKGIYKFDWDKGRFNYIEFDLDNDVKLNSIYTFLKDSKKRFWIGTNIGLLKYDEVTKKVVLHAPNANSKKSRLNTSINVIYEDKKGGIWFGTLDGLVKFEEESNSFKNYYSDPNKDASLSSNNVQAILEDNSGELWIGTATGGINRVRNRKNLFKHYYHVSSNKYSLSENTIRAVYSDHDGDLWVGTLGGGLNFRRKGESRFHRIKNIPQIKNSLSLDQVSAIYYDDEGTLWVGTWKGGLNVLKNAKKYIENPSMQKFEIYKNDPNNSNSLADNTIQWIYEDSKKQIWLGTGRGLDLFNRESNEFIHIRNTNNDELSISDDRIQSNGIIEDKNGNIWVGTWDGLNRIRIRNNKIDHIHHFYHDENDSNSISDNRIISLKSDVKGNIWIGTYGGGLNKIDFRNLEIENIVFEKWNDKDGLANNIIYGIETDFYGELWLSTNNGLSKFNSDKEEFKNYYASDGLQNNQFFWGASASGYDGTLYFGGINGLNVFHPNEILEVESKFIPPVYITDFKKFGISFNFDSSITTKKQINLSYTDNFFSFVYSALDFIDPGKINYAYKLDGFDEDWRYVENRKFANYTNVSGGEYVFKVKSTNSDGIWNDNVSEIAISIEPPFWETWWFRIGGILLALSSVLLFTKLKTNSINKQNIKLDEEVKKRTLELSREIQERKKTEDNLRAHEEELKKLIASKDKFFSIISHDLRSPFSALLGITGLLVSDYDELTDEEKIDYISSIEKTSKGVYNLLENLLEWSRVHTGMMEFNPKIAQLSLIVNEVINLLEVNAINKKIELNFSVDEKLYFYGDTNMVYTILRNLVSNAIKFTQKGGKVSLTAKKTSKQIEIQIKDSGVGMEEEIVEKLFDIDVSHSTIGTSGERGTGLGLSLSKDLALKNNGDIKVQSKLHEGTIFKLYLPISIDEF